ncbi:MAG: GSCFA domain-containing protein [Sulfitobacter sp.]
MKFSYLNAVLSGSEKGLSGREIKKTTDMLEPFFQPVTSLAFMLKQHTPDKFKHMRKTVMDSDAVILDTHYEARQSVTLPLHRSKAPVALSLSNVTSKESPLVAGSPPNGTESAKHAFEIIQHLGRINPQAKIILLNYPVTAYRQRDSIFHPSQFGAYDERRIDILTEFNQAFEALLADAPDDIAARTTFVNVLEVGTANLAKKGKPYFQPNIYDNYADIIERVCQSGGDQDEAEVVSALSATVPAPAEPTPEPAAAPVMPVAAEASVSEQSKVIPMTTAPATQNPYKGLPDRNYWRPAVADRFPMAIDQLYDRKYEIAQDDKVATCGSCFAQHIGRYMAESSFNFIDVEPLLPTDNIADPTSLGYGLYSARYGNVYTSRQLLQLFQRAFGATDFDEAWQTKDGRYVDPFRPNLCGGGWDTAEEMRAEQAKHLAAVRRMFEELDVFVFTMGLTEFWANRTTGAAYPICPGVTAGDFSPHEHEFINLSVFDVVKDMERFIEGLQLVNPTAKVFLTVSPVPLVATAEDSHVIVSTTASKSILRASAEHLKRSHANVDYFPSYEVITAPAFGGMFFEANKRGVRPEGVKFVMSHFFAAHQPPVVRSSEVMADPEGFCDEEFLDAGA